MKIFLSWSTEPSKFIAQVLKDWIPSVIQAARPWFSDSDIDRGTRWSAEIASELEQSKFGILCLTPENLTAPWINFEAGALAKTLNKTYVVPLLFELEPSDLVGPLSQFNAARINAEDMEKLVLTINSSLENSLEVSIVKRSFEMWWPELEKKIAQVPKVKIAKKDKRSDRDILEEILGLVRTRRRLSGEFLEPVDNAEEDIIQSRRLEIAHIQGDTVIFPGTTRLFRAGKYIYHARLGKGKIVKILESSNEKLAMIEFESGRVQINLNNSNLGIFVNEPVQKKIIESSIDEFPPLQDLPL